MNGIISAICTGVVFLIAGLIYGAHKNRQIRTYIDQANELATRNAKLEDEVSIAEKEKQIAEAASEFQSQAFTAAFDHLKGLSDIVTGDQVELSEEAKNVAKEVSKPAGKDIN